MVKKQNKTKTVKKPYTQPRNYFFPPFQKRLVSDSVSAEQAHKTYVSAHAARLGRPEVSLRASSGILSISHLRLAFSRLPSWSVAWFLFFPLRAVELDFYFPAAYIPRRKGKLIHEVPICIKHRNICHKILVSGWKHQEILPLIVCPQQYRILSLSIGA